MYTCIYRDMYIDYWVDQKLTGCNVICAVLLAR